MEDAIALEFTEAVSKETLFQRPQSVLHEKLLDTIFFPKIFRVVAGYEGVCALAPLACGQWTFMLGGGPLILFGVDIATLGGGSFAEKMATVQQASGDTLRGLIEKSETCFAMKVSCGDLVYTPPGSILGMIATEAATFVQWQHMNPTLEQAQKTLSALTSMVASFPTSCTEQCKGWMTYLQETVHK